MRRIPILIGLLFLSLLFVMEVTADDTDWPDFDTQATGELWWFYDSTGAVVLSETEFRAYVVGVGDTTDANNYVDSVYDSTCSCHIFAPERTSRFRLTRKDNGAGTGNESVVLVGPIAPKDWVDTEAIQANAITDPLIDTNALNDRHVADGTFDGEKLTDGTLSSAKFEAETFDSTRVIQMDGGFVKVHEQTYSFPGFTTGANYAFEGAVERMFFVANAISGGRWANAHYLSDGQIRITTASSTSDSIRVVGFLIE